MNKVLSLFAAALLTVAASNVVFASEPPSTVDTPAQDEVKPAETNAATQLTKATKPTEGDEATPAVEATEPAEDDAATQLPEGEAATEGEEAATEPVKPVDPKPEDLTPAAPPAN